jgi:hypothetical protein
MDSWLISTLRTCLMIIIIIIVTVTKSYSVYIKYYSKQGEKIMVLVRILMSKSGFLMYSTAIKSIRVSISRGTTVVLRTLSTH